MEKSDNVHSQILWHSWELNRLPQENLNHQMLLLSSTAGFSLSFHGHAWWQKTGRWFFTFLTHPVQRTVNIPLGFFPYCPSQRPAGKPITKEEKVPALGHISSPDSQSPHRIDVGSLGYGYSQICLLALSFVTHTGIFYSHRFSPQEGLKWFIPG